MVVLDDARGYFAEGSRLLDAALAAASEPTPLRARALVAAGALDVRLARPSASSRSPRRRARSAATLGDRHAVARALLLSRRCSSRHAQ